MSLIARSDDLRRNNQRRILHVLRRHGPMSRTEISAATGLSASTVTAITAAFLDSSVLIETPSPDNALSRRGRPQVTLALNPSAASIAALSLSLNRVSAAVVDYAGNVVGEVVNRVSTRTADGPGLANAMADALRAAIDASPAPLGPLRHIAMGVQGVTDSEGTTMLWSPITRHANLALSRLMGDAFGVPATLANDCNMIAQALKWRFPDHFSASFAAVLLSHGIGMGLIVNNQVVGGISSSATEFGHMIHAQDGAQQGALCRCGRHGCVEAYAGDYAIWRAAHALNPRSPPVDDLDPETMRELADRARKNGRGAEYEAYRSAGLAIGSALRSMFALFDPFPVAFVGTGAAAFDLLEAPIREAIGDSAIGMISSQVEMFSFPDEFPLVRDGAAIKALDLLDNHVFAPAEAPITAARERRMGHAS